MKVEHSLLKVKILGEYWVHVPIHHLLDWETICKPVRKQKSIICNLFLSQNHQDWFRHCSSPWNAGKSMHLPSSVQKAHRTRGRGEERLVTCCFGKHRTHSIVGWSFGTIPSSVLTKIPFTRNPVSLGRGYKLEEPNIWGNSRLREGGVVGRIQVTLWRQEEAEV